MCVCCAVQAPGPFVTLHAIRHVMITEVLDNAEEHPANVEAAATLMGNSPATWDSHYHLGRGGKLVAAGLQHVEEFKSRLLAGRKRERRATSG